MIKLFKCTSFIVTKSFNRCLCNVPSKHVIENWSLKITPNELTKRANELINNSRKIYDSVALLQDVDINCDNVLKVLDSVECEFTTKRKILDYAQHISTDSALRNASREADKILQAFDVEISMRQDLFKKLTVLEKQKDQLKPESKRFLEKLIKYGKRNGLHLPEEAREEIMGLKIKINDLCIQFLKNIAEESTLLEFSSKELLGLPEDFINNLKKLDNGKYQVSLKYPDYFPVIKLCRNPDTRRSMFVAFQSRCVEENAPILNEVVKLRHKLANLLGYPTHSSYVTEVQMSESEENVRQFLTELASKLKPLWQKEKAYLLKLKEKECDELGIPFDSKLNAYDLPFYSTKVETIKYAVDQTKLKEYFPLPTVTQGLLAIYQELLGLKFTEIKDAEVWHEDVKMYSVEDSSTGVLLGYFFLDLFPRDGKYGHACCMGFQPGCLSVDGTRQVAVASIVTNFTKPQMNKPSLLNFNEVETLFHEFGHLMHYICSQTEHAHFCGFAVEKDFVEVPSQLLENWCWEEKPLRKMSTHYADKSEIPEFLLKSLITSRTANTGYRNLSIIASALSDFRIHSCHECDIKQVFYDTYKEIMEIQPMDETFMACSFVHLCGGYDAQYYSYLWSEVYSMDIFHTKFKNGKVMDKQVGMDYRRKILQPGASKDAMDLIVDFLGREPTHDAFLCSKGLKS